jgi:hypothetical protein
MPVPTSRLVRRFMPALFLLAGIAAVAAGPVDASSKEKRVKGSFDGTISTGPGCTSPAGLCGTAVFKGGLKGDAEFAAQSASPTGTAGLTLVNSTGAVHTKDGDLVFEGSGIANLTPGSDGETVAIIIITGGTGKWAGASGYLQALEFVVGDANFGDYEGKILLP